MPHYLILGPTCGRDWRKRFHCDCGQCRELPEDWENLDFPVFFTEMPARRIPGWLQVPCAGETKMASSAACAEDAGGYRRSARMDTITATTEATVEMILRLMERM